MIMLLKMLALGFIGCTSTLHCANNEICTTPPPLKGESTFYSINNVPQSPRVVDTTKIVIGYERLVNKKSLFNSPISEKPTFDINAQDFVKRADLNTCIDTMTKCTKKNDWHEVVKQCTHLENNIFLFDFIDNDKLKAGISFFAAVGNWPLIQYLIDSWHVENNELLGEHNIFLTAAKHYHDYEFDYEYEHEGNVNKEDILLQEKRAAFMEKCLSLYQLDQWIDANHELFKSLSIKEFQELLQAVKQASESRKEESTQARAYVDRILEIEEKSIETTYFPWIKNNKDKTLE